MHTFFTKEDGSRMAKLLLAVAAVIALYFGMKFINEVKTFRSIGVAPTQMDTISVSGDGEAFAIPDVATAGFSIEQKARTIKEAQDVVNKKMGNTIAFLAGMGIAEKDIKTVSYSAYPEYSYSRPCYTANCPEVTEQATLLGYTVYQSVSIKIRDTEKVGEIVQGLGDLGITGLTGPDFTVDDPDMVQAEARKKAIEDAKERARILEEDLGVRLVKIVSFYENQGGYYPMYDTKVSNEAMGMGGATPAEIPVGENKFTSNVTITYEIR